MSTSICTFELFHGACLTRLIRRDRPAALRLIETDMSQSWSIYLVNDLKIFIKHRSKYRKLRNGGRSWSFPFAENQLSQIREGCYVALVCGAENIRDDGMEICFIKKQDIQKLFVGNAKSVSVSYVPGESFRVSSSAISKKLVISRNALNTIEIPT